MANATLLYENTFADGFGDVGYMYQCRSDQFTVVTGPSGKAKSIKVYAAGDVNSVCAEYGGRTFYHRNQVVHAYSNWYSATYPTGIKLYESHVGPFWFGAAVRLSSNNPQGGGWYNSAYIFFDIKLLGTGFGEPTMYITDGSNLRVDPNPSAPFNMTLSLDTWHSVIYYVERRVTGGVFRFWLDGVLKINYTGQTCINVANASEYSMFRTGPYWGAEARGGNITNWFTDVRIAIGGSDGYALVDPTQTTPPTGPSITGSIESTSSAMPATVNLTSLGTVDWAHWGYLVASTFNHKATGGSLISDTTATGTKERWTPTPAAFSWSDGTPTTTLADTTTEQFVTSGTLSFTVTAGTTTRVLKVYVQCTWCTMTVVASMSATTATAKTVTVDDAAGAGTTAIAEFTFAADSATTLTVTMTKTVDHSVGNSSIELMAATLSLPSSVVIEGSSTVIVPRKWGQVGNLRRRSRY